MDHTVFNSLAEEAKISTFQQHILSEQKERSPHASGSFSWLLSGITLATKMIAARVRRAGLLDVAGAAGNVNIQGEDQQKLDVYSDEAMIHCLGVRDNVAILASEENENAIVFDGRKGEGKYIILFDPLDGSSNIDVNVSVGTIFSIFALPPGLKGDSDPAEAVLQPGNRQLAAGYVLYGSSTMLVYTTGNGVHGFTLDPAIGAYLLSHENIRMPTSGTYYSCNCAYEQEYPPEYQTFLAELRSGNTGRRYSMRYIGSLVADFHRTLLKGGIFLYPTTAQSPEGKLRLLYEASPMAFIAEQAGGVATDGQTRIMDLSPKSIHQRTSLVLGGCEEAEILARHQRMALDAGQTGVRRADSAAVCPE